MVSRNKPSSKDLSMRPYEYYDVMRQSKDPKYFRYLMAIGAIEQGVKPTARDFQTTPKTVRKWRDRWETLGWNGLNELSRAPHQPHRFVSAALRKRVIQLKRKLKPWGAQRIRDQYELDISEKTIRKIWREEGLIKKKRRKHKTKQCLRHVKAQWEAFKQTDFDTKDLDDIPELWPQIRLHKLPLIQYTAREVTCGVQFLAYAQERSLDCANLFAQLIIEHLQKHGVDLDGCRFQSDNGSEFIGSWNAKSDSAFTKTIQAVQGLVHTTCPPGAHTWQADVETVHRLIEDEFYEVERFRSRQDFLDKAYAYNLWFNIARKNTGKENQTPLDILDKKNKNIDPAVVDWRPVFLDELLIQNLEQKQKGGYDVGQYPFSQKNPGNPIRFFPLLRRRTWSTPSS